MNVTLSSGKVYDLSSDVATKRLINNFRNYRARHQMNKLEPLMLQVLPYENYAGANKALLNAKKICTLLKPTFPTLQIPATAPAPQIAVAPVVAPVPVPKGLLYIPEMQTGTIYVVSMAPINSSGDIYHILACLMLWIHHHKTPDISIQLNYDVPVSIKDGKPVSSHLTVGDQVKRSIDFADTLGLKKYFKAQELPYQNTGRENVRDKTVYDHFKAKSQELNKPICYIDQMATTVIVAKHVDQHGLERTTQIIRDGFSQRNRKSFTPKAQRKVDNYVAEVVGQLDNIKPVVVMQVRYSSKANNQLNMPDNFIQGFIQTLQKDYQICLILSDDRSVKNRYKGTVVTEPFKGTRFFINGIDYGKQAHLQLLLSLKNKPNTKGIIGNTSGTLDVAAFIGLAAYSIHQFTVVNISYQECRLAFQMKFLSLGALNENNELDPGFQPWLDDPKNGSGSNLFTLKEMQPEKRISEQKNKHGYTKIFHLTFFKDGKKRSIPLPGAEELITEVLTQEL